LCGRAFSSRPAATATRPRKACGRERRAAVTHKHEWRWRAFPLEPAQRPQLVAIFARRAAVIAA
jgi:hypothetical protein